MYPEIPYENNHTPLLAAGWLIFPWNRFIIKGSLRKDSEYAKIGIS
jgi:hypothetical protein